jgi:5'-phosphate synthase pdxT subunit
MKIGVLALQGGFQAHAQILKQLGCEPHLVRQAEDLDHLDGLVIPGGESSVMLKLALETGILSAIKKFHLAQKPIFGTCAGAILLAGQVFNPQQFSLDLVGISIERNSFGRQLASKISRGHFIPEDREIEMVFIRAPKILAVRPGVHIIAHYQQQAVCVEDKHCLAATFHPELSQDDTLHRYFLTKVQRSMHAASTQFNPILCSVN